MSSSGNGALTGTAAAATYGWPVDVAFAGAFDARRALFNYKPDQFASWRTKLAAAKAGTGTAHYVASGTSLTSGVGGNNPQLNSYPGKLAEYLTTRGLPVTGGMVVTSNNNNATNGDPRWSYTGTWNTSTSGSIAEFRRESTAVGNTATFTSNLPGTIAEVFYLDGAGGGNMTVTIDGGAPVAVNNTASGTVKTYSVTGLANTTHTITITVTAQIVYLLAARVRTATGVMISNAGIGSSQSSWWTSGLWYENGGMLTDPAVFGADLLSIEGPMNDALNTVPVATAKANYQIILDRAKFNSIPTLLILDHYPNPDPGWGGTIINALSPANWAPYRQMFYDLAAKYDLPLLDFGYALGDPVKWRAAGYNSDGVHLSYTGYWREAKIIEAVLA